MSVFKSTRVLVCRVFEVTFPVVLAFGFGTASSVMAEPDIPISGFNLPAGQSIDQAMLKHFKNIDCTTASLSITVRGRLVVSRAYGWTDRQRSVPATPDILIGIASCEKSFTSAAVRSLARQGKFRLDANIFTVLGVEPAGEVIDPRVHSIKIGHLLNHKTGWMGAPLRRARRAASNQLDRKNDPLSVLSHLMTQNLASTPGTKYEYDNFAFDVLRALVRKATGRPADEFFRDSLFRHAGVSRGRGIRSTRLPSSDGESPRVWNARSGGPICASTPALCFFMKSYWMGGQPRKKGNQTWKRWGSLPGSTAGMIWKAKGVNIAFAFNKRGSSTHGQIDRDLSAALKTALTRR